MKRVLLFVSLIYIAYSGTVCGAKDYSANEAADCYKLELDTDGGQEQCCYLKQGNQAGICDGFKNKTVDELKKENTKYNDFTFTCPYNKDNNASYLRNGLILVFALLLL